MFSMISLLPMKAPAGNPPPMILAIVVMSGVTPYLFWAPPDEALNPVMTSSKIKITSFSSVILLTSSR